MRLVVCITLLRRRPAHPRVALASMALDPSFGVAGYTTEPQEHSARGPRPGMTVQLDGSWGDRALPQLRVLVNAPD